MPGQLHRFRDRRSVPKQLRDVSVPARGVKVSHALGCLVRNADSLQVFLDHQPGSTLGQLGKQEIVGFQSIQPLAEQDDKVGMERKDVFTAMLRVRRFDSQQGRIGF